MNALSVRSLLIVASLQASTALAALFSSKTAALAAGAVGVLALGRYAALALFASSLGSPTKPLPRVLAASAWILGFAALLAAVAAVALRAKAALPWAVVAAFAGPVGLSALALGSGIRALASGRGSGAVHTGGHR